MENTVICYRRNCKYNNGGSCGVATVEIGVSGCLAFEEIDIYEEAEGFKRDD